MFPDADMDVAIKGTANAIFFNMGQCCTAGSRLFAHKRVFDQLMEGIAAEAEKIQVGPGLNPASQMGPLVSDEQFARVTGFLDSGRKEGARVVTGGERVGNAGYFVAPTVLTDTRPEMSVMRNEIFGPVVCAIPFDDDDLDRVARPTTRITASTPVSGRVISALPTSWHAASVPVPCGSIRITLATWRCHLAATRSPVGVAKWARRFWNSTRRPRRSPRRYDRSQQD